MWRFVIFIVFLAAVILSALVEATQILFVLGIPWSMGIAILSPVIAHSSGKSGMNLAVLATSVINLLLILAWALVRKNAEKND